MVLEEKKETLLSNSVAHSYQNVNIISYTPDRILIETNLDQAGILVLTDTYYSSWRAYIDGEETEIYPANVLFRGVFVPAGTHLVYFNLRPRWFWPSISASFGVFIVTLAMFLRKNRMMNWLRIQRFRLK